MRMEFFDEFDDVYGNSYHTEVIQLESEEDANDWFNSQKILFSPESNEIAMYAFIVSSLPEEGQFYFGRTVASVEPNPLYGRQPTPDVYAYSIWKVTFSDSPKVCYVAIHEPESETM